MTAASPKKTSAERTRAWRTRMRAQGLKPVTVWTFDESDPAFMERLQADLRRMAQGADERAVQHELDEHFAAVMEDEPEYDWGPAGPPSS